MCKADFNSIKVNANLGAVVVKSQLHQFMQCHISFWKRTNLTIYPAQITSPTDWSSVLFVLLYCHWYLGHVSGNIGSSSVVSYRYCYILPYVHSARNSITILSYGVSYYIIIVLEYHWCLYKSNSVKVKNLFLTKFDLPAA